MSPHSRMKLRNTAKWAWMGFLYSTGQLRRARKRLAERGIVVLTFHRVLDDREFASTFSPQGMLVRRSTFEGFLRYAAENCHIVSVDGPEAQRDNKTCCPKIAVTFDDGWEDNARTVFPITQKHAIPVTIFVVAGKLGEASPFWPERFTGLWRSAEGSPEKIHRLADLAGLASAGQNGNGQASFEILLKRMKELQPGERDRVLEKMTATIGPDSPPTSRDALDRTMSWEEVGTLARAHVNFGSHTQTHPILPQLPADAVRQELTDSKAAIEEKLGKPCEIFSYPNGDSSAEVREEVVRSGYRLAFLNNPGLWTRECDPYSIPRVNIWEGKMAGPSGKFSRIVFEYTVFYKNL